MRDKEHFLARVGREMEEDLEKNSLSTEETLAACCRILAHEGHESGLAGQVTALGEKPNTWWTLKFGLGFEEATGERGSESALPAQAVALLDGGAERQPRGICRRLRRHVECPGRQTLWHSGAGHARA